MSIRLRAAPFNITIIQVYAPTFGHDDSKVDHFYQQFQETIDQTPKKDILVVQGDRLVGCFFFFFFFGLTAL